MRIEREVGRHRLTLRHGYVGGVRQITVGADHDVVGSRLDRQAVGFAGDGHIVATCARDVDLPTDRVAGKRVANRAFQEATVRAAEVHGQRHRRHFVNKGAGEGEFGGVVARGDQGARVEHHFKGGGTVGGNRAAVGHSGCPLRAARAAGSEGQAIDFRTTGERANQSAGSGVRVDDAHLAAGRVGRPVEDTGRLFKVHALRVVRAGAQRANQRAHARVRVDLVQNVADDVHTIHLPFGVDGDVDDARARADVADCGQRAGVRVNRVQGGVAAADAGDRVQRAVRRPRHAAPAPVRGGGADDGARARGRVNAHELVRVVVQRIQRGEVAVEEVRGGMELRHGADDVPGAGDVRVGEVHQVAARIHIQPVGGRAQDLLQGSGLLWRERGRIWRAAHGERFAACRHFTLEARNVDGHRPHAHGAGAAVTADAGLPVNGQRTIVHHGDGGADHIADFHRLFNVVGRVAKQGALQGEVLRGDGVRDDGHAVDGFGNVVVRFRRHVVVANSQRHGIVAAGVGVGRTGAGAADRGDRCAINAGATIQVCHRSGERTGVNTRTAPVNNDLHDFQPAFQEGDGFEGEGPEGGAVDAAIFVEGSAVAVVADEAEFGTRAGNKDVRVVGKGVGESVGAEATEDGALTGDAGVVAGIIRRRTETEVVGHEGRLAAVIVVVLRADEEAVATVQPAAEGRFARRARTGRAAKFVTREPDDGGVWGQVT